MKDCERTSSGAVVRVLGILIFERRAPSVRLLRLSHGIFCVPRPTETKTNRRGEEDTEDREKTTLIFASSVSLGSSLGGFETASTGSGHGATAADRSLSVAVR